MRRLIRRLSQRLSRWQSKRKAAVLGVPFRTRVWYNYQAFIPKEEYKDKRYVEIFDEQDRYIVCPPVGGTVVYNCKGVRCLYLVVGFKNESPDRDWLYESDYINPVIEFINVI